jgi:ssDNA-binding protein
MSQTAEKPAEAVEEVANAVRYDDGTIMLKNVRASYPHVLKAQPNKNEKGEITGYSYSIKVLLPKDTHVEAKKLVQREIMKILKENNRGEKIPTKLRFLRDGDPADEDDVGKPEEAGCWTVSARESKRPVVIDNRKDPKTGQPRRLNPDNPEDNERIYGGCYVNVMIRPWWQSNVNGKRVNAGLSVVQFRKDGEPFGSGRITDDVVDSRFSSELEDDDGEVEDSDYDDL